MADSIEQLNALFEMSTYGPGLEEKRKFFREAMREASRFHYEHCIPYRTLCDKRGFGVDSFEQIEDIPYLTTSVFKDALLLSISENDVFREIRSSATSSGRSSRIGIDKETSRRQSKCFSKVVVDRIGQERCPFLVLDVPSSVQRSAVASARSSTIRALLFCASEVKTCLSDESGELRLQREVLFDELSRVQEEGTRLVLFGFTYVLYHYVVRPLLEAGETGRFQLPGAKILHIGGWKKLEAQKVSPEKLISDCCEVFGVQVQDVVDFYGFTEQAGLIYPTCEAGLRHTPVWVEVLVRDLLTLKALPPGCEGLLQFLTPIQTAYPGHSVLTDDVGMIIGVDDCPCGRKGTTFRVLGRAPEAEVRGCGDIMAEKFV